MTAELPFQFTPGDPAYLEYLAQHLDGFVLTSSHSYYPLHTVIHRAACPRIRQLQGNALPGGFTERGYLKVFGSDIPSLQQWVVRRRPNGSSRLCSHCRPGETTEGRAEFAERFRVGLTYTKSEIYRLCAVPPDKQRGAWDTGYTSYEGSWFIFCNVGVPGRTGHDYDNRFQGDDLIWYGKTGSHDKQPSIQAMLGPATPVLVFYRDDDRAAFTFAGCARALSHGGADPVEIVWSFERSAHERSEVLPEELSDETEIFLEGAVKRIAVNAYERNPQARAACLRAHGLSCAVCDFNFASVYGEIGENFIHVHHLKPIALTDSEYTINPVEDLRPVCPNCHAMLHRRKGPIPYSIEELAAFIFGKGDGDQ